MNAPARRRVVRPFHFSIMVLMLMVSFCASFLGVRSASADSVISIVDTLGAATPSTQFSIFGGGGFGIFPDHFIGPEFTLTQPTVITEIGAFVESCLDVFAEPPCPNGLPLAVQIRPSTNGVPDPSIVLASFVLSDDNDPFKFSYESVMPQLLLEPGTYFAIFAPQGNDRGILLGGAQDPFPYLSGRTVLGVVYPSTGVGDNIQFQFAAVRILGVPAILEVGLDIKPGSSVNPINLRSQGKTLVAILSTTDFNAPSQVVQDSLTFGRTGQENSLASCQEATDVNHDGLIDLVCHFYTQHTDFQSGNTVGILQGETVSGRTIIGRDSVQIVPKAKA